MSPAALAIASGSATGARRPLSRNFQSSRPDEVLDYVSRNLSPHQMNLADPAHMSARLRCLDMTPAQIVDISYGTDVRIDADELESHFLVHAGISGTSHVWASGRSAEITSSNLYVSSPGSGMRIHMSAECRHLAVRIARSAFEDYLARWMNIAVNRPLVFYEGGQGERELPDAWRQLLRHMIEQSEAAPALMAAPRTRQHYSLLLMEMLLNNHCNSYSDQIALYGNDIAPRHVRKAREIIHDSIEESICVTDLARRVGVSPRSLQNGFRQFLGVTPVEYVRRHRLERLHRALMEAVPEHSVTELMLECGILNFGRYAHYYRQQYGCRPSDTLRARLA